MTNRTEWLKRQPATRAYKKLRVASWVLSAVVLTLVVGMDRISIPLPEGVSTAFLPPIYSILNTIAALCLVVGLIAIRKGSVAAHRKAMSVAGILSVAFLLLYVLYHTTNPHTEFGGEGIIRKIYYFLLITHILLAAVSLPFICFAFASGFTNHFAAHRKLVRWVFPIWLYVAVTGPMVYLMLWPYYER